MTNNPQAFPISANFDVMGRYFDFKSLRSLRNFCMKNAKCCAPLIVKERRGNIVRFINIVKANKAPFWKFEARQREER